MGLDRFIHNPPPAGVSAAGWTKRVATLETIYPRLANAVNLAPGAAAYAFGAYVNLTASAAADFFPNMAHLQYVLAPAEASGLFRSIVEVEIATGAVGAEAIFARISDVWAANHPGTGAPALVSGVPRPVGPALIPSGTRIAARVRQSVATSVSGLGVQLYLAGYDTSVPASDTTYGLDDYLAGVNSPHLFTTNWGATFNVTPASFPAYGAWAQAIASAPFDLLVEGVVYRDTALIAANMGHLQFGIGAAGAETAYSLVGIPGRTIVPNVGFQSLRRPLLVLAGERLAVRMTASNASVYNCQVFYHEL